MTGLSECVIVMLECIAFDGLMQRHQHMARELSKYTQVIYVEETPSHIRHIFDGKILDPALSAHRKGLQEISPNLHLFKAPPCVPRSTGYRRSIEGSTRRTFQSLKPHLPKGKKVITWLFSPVAAPSIGMYGEILSIFDYFDAFGEFPGEEKYRTEVKKAVADCARGCDIIIATNDELKEHLVGYNSSAYIVQNGCDPDHFGKGGTEPAPGMKIIDIESLPHPVIGYMGDIGGWFELEFMEHIARKHPDWSVVLLGTWKRDKPPPKELPNIYIPGRVSYEELPWYARHFDVGTIPFELSDLTRVVNPLKLYEYFAMGIPVVASPLPEIVRHEDLVYVASGSDEFLALTEVAVREKADSPARKKRSITARANSWTARGERVKEILEENLADR